MITAGQHLEEKGITKIKRKATKQSHVGIFLFIYLLLSLAEFIYSSLFSASAIGYVLMLCPFVLSGTPGVPIKIYANSDVQKLEILSENKGKSGVYL
jgi:hypothetical protein